MKNTYDFHIEKMQSVMPSMAYDGCDYETWKQSAREKLRELLGMEKYIYPGTPAMIEYDIQQEGFREIRFLMETEKDYFVPCHLCIPDGIQKPPVMICLQGHAPGMYFSLGRVTTAQEQEMLQAEETDFALQAVKNGMAAVCLEQRNFGELEGEGRCLYSALTAMLQGRTTIGERVHDVSVCIDILEKQFTDLVDTQKLCCLGLSGGGTAAAYAAALEDRIGLIVSAGAMCTFRASIGGMPHCACNYVPHMAAYFDMGDLMAMAAPKCFIQVNGDADDIFPIAGAEEVFEKGSRVYEQLGIKERCALVVGHGGHKFYGNDTWPVIYKMLGY